MCIDCKTKGEPVMDFLLSLVEAGKRIGAAESAIEELNDKEFSSLGAAIRAANQGRQAFATAVAMSERTAGIISDFVAVYLGKVDGMDVQHFVQMYAEAQREAEKDNGENCKEDPATSEEALRESAKAFVEGL